MHAPARLQLPTRMNHRFVSVVAERLEQKQFRWRARITCAEQACVEDARRIKNDCVASRNQIDEIAKLPVLDVSRLSMDDHQPALIAPLSRYLRYLIGREMKIVMVCSASVSNQKREGCAEPP